MLELNQIYNENCIETMSKMPDKCLDLTIAGPPYGKARKYNGYEFNDIVFENIAKELFRVTKNRGVVVWIVADTLNRIGYSGDSAKQQLFFMSKECGFDLYCNIIWVKTNPAPSNAKKRYRCAWENIFVFSKGKPKTSIVLTEETKNPGKEVQQYTSINGEGWTAQDGKFKIPPRKSRSNVWFYATSYDLKRIVSGAIIHNYPFQKVAPELAPAAPLPNILYQLLEVGLLIIDSG